MPRGRDAAEAHGSRQASTPQGACPQHSQASTPQGCVSTAGSPDLNVAAMRQTHIRPFCLGGPRVGVRRLLAPSGLSLSVIARRSRLATCMLALGVLCAQRELRSLLSSVLASATRPLGESVARLVRLPLIPHTFGWCGREKEGAGEGGRGRCALRNTNSNSNNSNNSNNSDDSGGGKSNNSDHQQQLQRQEPITKNINKTTTTIPINTMTT